MIWIELLNANHDVLQRLRLGQHSVQIGRAYDNDVVVDDPHVAPHHLRVTLTDRGEPRIEDLGSINGLWVWRRRWSRVGELVVHGDDLLRIGRSLLRVRVLSYEVAPEQPLTAAPQRSVTLVGMLLLGLCGVMLLQTDLDRTDPADLNMFAIPLITLLGMLAGCTVIWVTIGRIFGGSLRWMDNFRIVAGGLLVWSLISMLWPMIGYALSWASALQWRETLGWLFAGGVTMLLLQTINTRYAAVKAVVVFGIVAAAISAQLIGLHKLQERFGTSAVLGDLEPPALRVVPQQSLDDFMSATVPFEAELQQTRKEDPPV